MKNTKIGDIVDRLVALKLVTPMPVELSGGVCIIEVPREQRRKVLNRMYEEYGIAGSTSGGLRICPHLYNTREQVERVVAGVKGMRSVITG